MSENDDTTAPLHGLLQRTEVEEVEAEAPTAFVSQTGAALPAEEHPKPRIRWASIAWGLLFAAFGVSVIWTTTAPARRAAFTDWVIGLDWAGWIIAGVLLLGGLLLVLGITAGLRALGGGRKPRVSATRW